MSNSEAHMSTQTFESCLQTVTLIFKLAIQSTSMAKPETLERLQFKERILRVARKGGDWKVVADALEVNYKTAWLWVSQERKRDLQETPAAPPTRSWGGKRAEKIKREHLAFLERLLGDNCFATPRDMVAALEREFGLRVVQATVQKRLRGAMYSLHRPPPLAQTSAEQQALTRREFAAALVRLTAAGKRVFFADETNYNLWCPRRLERCRNVHVFACLSADGVAHWAHASGALEADDMPAFVCRALDAIAARGDAPLEDVVLVVDSAASVALLPEVLAADDRYRGVRLLQLPPLSAMLNACDSVFAAFRASVRQFLRTHEQEICGPAPEGKTVIEHRSVFLARAADELFPLASTPQECAKSVGQVYELMQAMLEVDSVATQKTVDEDGNVETQKASSGCS